MSIINKIGQGLTQMLVPDDMVKCSEYAQKNLDKNVIKTAKGLSHFKGSEALLPVIMIETFVTSGRTYQAQKRGGANEARERFIEQGSSAVVWFFGVRLFKKIGNFIGDKLGLKDINIDVGKDALRNPFANLVKEKKAATSIFKFGKITSAVFLATGIVGFVIPKINIAITNKKLEEANKKKQNENGFIERGMRGFDNFMANSKAGNTSFKGNNIFSADTLRVITNAFENNTVVQLVSQDAGIITGRTLNARNKYEATEYLFRDSVSIFFYMFSTPIILYMLNFISKNVNIHPQSALETAGFLMKKLEDGKFDKLKAEDFRKLALGAEKTDEEIKAETELLEKLFRGADGKQKPTITLSEFEEFAKDKGKDVIKKANKMTTLQPIFEGKEGVLTPMQVQDVLSNKWTSDPELLKKVADEATNGKAGDEKRFVRQKSLEKIRISVDKFTEGLVKSAKGKEIDKNFINKYVKKNVYKNTLFTAIGIIISGLALAVFIPKIQCLITEKSTGKSSFPGTTKY